MKLHFDRKEVEKLVAHSQQAEEHIVLYNEIETGPGDLLLVGDRGIYLMSAAADAFERENPQEGESKIFVAYSREVNPNTDPDDWYEVKEECFGADDGCDVLDAESVELMLELGDETTVCLDVSEEEILVVAPDGKESV